ncbi:hypothetical protein EPYR_03589 [Erwinia pyrifoliae DSM 12163]|nr:hypothetical protein EPYR_03589 [Erwinia pyrifoliae DSM 12163]
MVMISFRYLGRRGYSCIDCGIGTTISAASRGYGNTGQSADHTNTHGSGGTGRYGTGFGTG